MNARKPKVEVDDRITTEEDGDENSRDEQEEALVALIEHRTKEVEHIRKRITYYQSQVSSFFSLLFSQFFLFSYYSPKLKLLIFFLLSWGPFAYDFIFSVAPVLLLLFCFDALVHV